MSIILTLDHQPNSNRLRLSSNQFLIGSQYDNNSISFSLKRLDKYPTYVPYLIIQPEDHKPFSPICISSNSLTLSNLFTQSPNLSIQILLKQNYQTVYSNILKLQLTPAEFNNAPIDIGELYNRPVSISKSIYVITLQDITPPTLDDDYLIPPSEEFYTPPSDTPSQDTPNTDSSPTYPGSSVDTPIDKPDQAEDTTSSTSPETPPASSDTSSTDTSNTSQDTPEAQKLYKLTTGEDGIISLVESDSTDVNNDTSLVTSDTPSDNDSETPSDTPSLDTPVDTQSPADNPDIPTDTPPDDNSDSPSIGDSTPDSPIDIPTETPIEEFHPIITVIPDVDPTIEDSPVIHIPDTPFPVQFTTPSYIVGSNSLLVFKNGVLFSSYLEIGTGISFNISIMSNLLKANDVLTFMVFN